MLEHIQLLRNIGQFDSITPGAQLPFQRLTLIYAENGRGKTTLASIFRSLATGKPDHISERHRLGVAHPPHIIFHVAGRTVQFQNNTWDIPIPEVAIYDDVFVDENVCSGIEIDSGHRQKLHELILGARGVAINDALQAHVKQIEKHNTELTQKRNAIPTAERNGMNVDEFCGLPLDPNIDTTIETAKRALAAGQSSSAILQRDDFKAISLPAFDLSGINTLLARSLSDLEIEATERVREHLLALGQGGETWLGDGLERIEGVSKGRDYQACPFCAQDLTGSDLIRHYQTYFSEAYAGLLNAIAAAKQEVTSTHGEDATAGFERAVRIASDHRVFWAAFIKTPELAINTEVISKKWIDARDVVLDALHAKEAAPLEHMELPATAIAVIDDYTVSRSEVETISDALQATNAAIATIKAQVLSADTDALAKDLAHWNAVKARHTKPTSTLCQDYLNEKAAKTATEALREQARTALNNYRQQVFPTYEAAINDYLRRFNAGFSLTSINSADVRSGPSCDYKVMINNVHTVGLTSTAGPCFRNTLSAGDRNTLALAFFFASLDQDPQCAQKIVVIDDPMTSLDEHRSLTTVQEIRRLVDRVNQVIVLSHSKPFLCQLWDSANRSSRQAVHIYRSGAGSDVAEWDVNQACITEHDRRHALVLEYTQVANPATERLVATALRYILEVFMRVAYPGVFPPGSLLGPFLKTCQKRLSQPDQILNPKDTIELGDLLTYANRFHHDTNPAYATETINDQELNQFCRRVLAFTKR